MIVKTTIAITTIAITAIARATQKKGGSQTSRVSGEVFATPSTRIVSFASSNDAAQAGRTVVSTDDGGH